MKSPNKLHNEYAKLAAHLSQMIADGCQLVHGGNLFSWSDTNIPGILARIAKLQAQEAAARRK